MVYAGLWLVAGFQNDEMVVKKTMLGFSSLGSFLTDFRKNGQSVFERESTVCNWLCCCVMLAGFGHEKLR